MIVHFIGGPWHGRSEAIQNPQAVYRVAEPRSRSLRAAVPAGGSLPPIEDIGFDEHEYRITKRTPRYVIAEWEAPPVDVRFEVKLEIDPFDDLATGRLQQFIYERRTEEKHGVRCIGAAVSNGMEFDLSLQVRVEGPEDSVAIQLAAEKVQHYLDAELPPARQHIRQVSATT